MLDKRFTRGRKRRRTSVMVVALLLLSLLQAAPAAAGQINAGRAEWVAQPPLHHGRAGLGVATAGGQIFAVGGFDDTQILNVVEARAVTGAGTWRDVAPMPTARTNSGVAALGGLIYAVGGYGAGPDEPALAVVEVLDPARNRWTAGSSLPQPRGGMGAASLNGLLYVAGGYVAFSPDDYRISTSLLVFDPRRGAWRSAAPMPTPRDKFRLVAAAGYLYAIGGDNDAGASLASVDRYDPRSNTWSRQRPMSESRVVPCVVETVVGHRDVLAVIGGAQFDAQGNFVGGLSSTELYDLATGRWITARVQLPIVRGSLGCAFDAHGDILAIGGATPDGSQFRFLTDVDALKNPDPDGL